MLVEVEVSEMLDFSAEDGEREVGMVLTCPD